MPLGIVSSDVFDKELAKIIDSRAPGRPTGRKETPDSIKKIIIEENITNGTTQKDLASIFKVSQNSAMSYVNGRTSTSIGISERPDLKQFANSVRERVAKKARNRLFTALNELTPEKIADAKARDIASIAKDMSSIIKNMEPEPQQGPSAQFVFYAPPVVKEVPYEIINVSE